MLDANAARKVVLAAIPDGRINAFVSYGDLFVFQVFTDDEMEGQFDPFFSVNKNTGEFRDFSILTDGDPAEISRLFMEARKDSG